MPRSAVSIVIPTHNRLGYLRSALDSIAAQTFRHYEVIVVDDGSSEDIAGGLADHPTAPRVVRQRNLGPAAARNRGIAESCADTVAFLDSDDLWLPAKLERFMAALGAPSSPRIFYGPMSPIDESGSPIPGRTKPCHGGCITEKLFCSSFVHVPTIVCRKELLLEAGGFNEKLPVCEDYDLWLRISVNEPFGLIPEPLALRRLHESRLSKSRMSRNLAIKAEVLQTFFESTQGRAKLNPKIARTRLAKVCFAAGRAAFRAGEFGAAAWRLGLSRRYGTSIVGISPWLCAAFLLRPISREPDSPAVKRQAFTAPAVELQKAP